MSATVKRPYADALTIAQQLLAALEPGCTRSIIAGSLRRRKPEIGDIEIVALPKLEPVSDMFGDVVLGQEVNLLDVALAALAPLHYTKNGPKYKQFSFDGMTVDLFLASSATWGAVATIRTGSADFTHWLVTERRHGGACPGGMSFREGRIWFAGAALDTPEERDVFEAVEQPWIEPVERVEGRWRR